MYPIVVKLYKEDNLTDSSIDTAKEFNIIQETVPTAVYNRTIITNCIEEFCSTANSKDTPGCFPPYSTAPYDTWFRRDNCTVSANGTSGKACDRHFNLVR